MQPTFHRAWLCQGTLLLGSFAPLAVAQDPAAAAYFAITSITAQGTNLVLTATVPAGFGTVALEMRARPAAPWQPTGLPGRAPAGGGELSYTIPKPADMQFFRLRAGTDATGPSTVSPELTYVTIPPLGPETESTTDGKGGWPESEAVFHFKGMVDGSDRMLLSHEGVLWEHAHWDWPQGLVTVNGKEWDPRQKNYLTTAGTARFLPASFSLETAELERISGRDLVALERTNGALVLYLDDTPGGADSYEFRLRFRPARPTAARTARSTAAKLKVVAEIDGSDCLRITRAGATWDHKNWQGPAGVTLNQVPWPVEQTNVLRNAGDSRFLPPGIDFSTARILSRKGRDVVTASAQDQTLLVWFADNPNGSDRYELEIGFGP